MSIKQVSDFLPYQPHNEEEVSALWLAVARRGSVSPLLGKHLSPDDQLTHALL